MRYKEVNLYTILVMYIVEPQCEDNKCAFQCVCVHVHVHCTVSLFRTRTYILCVVLMCSLSIPPGIIKGAPTCAI